MNPGAARSPGLGEPDVPDLIELFEARCREVPGELALVVPGGSGRERFEMSYAALHARAVELAWGIEGVLGASPAEEPVVGLHFARTDPDAIPSQVACLMLGVPYLPLDPKQPGPYLRGIAEDAGARVVLTCGPREGDARSIYGKATCRPVEGLSGGAPTAPGAWRPPADRLAYLIFTSGTTGRPKGVLLERRGLSNLLDDDRVVFGLEPGDRVAHGSSSGYDSALEEVWMALTTGAAVVVVDDVTLRSGPDLVGWLCREGVTVLCPPPTLLRTMGPVEPADELPALRWLYVGGEALPEDIAERWGGGSGGAAGPRLVNGYGPTEATVTALRSEVTDPRDVRIGRPVRGASAHVVDVHGAPCADGVEGELWLAGPGLARGYLGDASQTRERFPETERFGRVYRTGDLARREQDGELTFLGRIDRQVQLRGHRIELEAVEAELARCDGVAEAACAVHGVGPRQTLVAWIVPQRAPGADVESGALDPRALRAALARDLPEPMVPARILVEAELPRNASGKLDRARLLSAMVDAEGAEGDAEDAQVSGDPLVRRVQEAVRDGLGMAAMPSTVADLFDELAADSLGVATLVSELRAGGGQAACVTVRDVYSARTCAGIAELARGAGRGTEEERAHSRPTAASLPQRLVFSLAQGAWLLGEFAAVMLLLRWIAYPTARWALDGGSVWWSLAALSPALFALRLALLPAAAAAARVARRLVLPVSRPGRHPAFGSVHLRHWVMGRVAAWIPMGLAAGTRLAPLLLRALGARVGRGVHLHRGAAVGGAAVGGGAWDLVEIGDGARLAQDAALRALDLDGGELMVGAVRIGAGATLEVRASMGPRTELGKSAALGPLAHLDPGASVPAGERWTGTPARPGIGSDAPRSHRASLGHDVGILGAGAALAWLRALAATGVLWATCTAIGLDLDQAVARGLEAPFTLWEHLVGLGVSASAVVIVDLVLAAVMTRALGGLAGGAGKGSSVAAWHAAGMVHGAGRWLSGSMLWPAWLRAAGMRVGAGAEISSIIDTVPRGVRIGAESFLADGVYLASDGGALPAEARGVPATSVGQGTFVGNHAVIPPGRELPDDLLLGVCTVANASVQGSGAWFGQPAFRLARPGPARFDRTLTHDPSLMRRINRGFWEGLRLALPMAGVALGLLWFRLLELPPGVPPGAAVPDVRSLATATLLVAGLAVAAGVLLKWALLGRVRAGEHPLWSCWCSRWDFHYVVWSFFARPWLRPFEGTLLLHWPLRALGMRIGPGALLGPGFSQVVDPDMLRFGRGATVAGHFQAHTFEDRVLKIAPLTLEEGATLGAAALAFYGAHFEPGSRAEPGSVTMKGERLLAGVTYAGAPLRPRGGSD